MFNLIETDFYIQIIKLNDNQMYFEKICLYRCRQKKWANIIDLNLISIYYN